MASASSANMSPKRLVLVVHGIGEQNSGDTLDGLVGAATGNIASAVQSEKRWLRDEFEEMNPRAVELFPCDIRKVTTKLSELVFAEVFWSDLSRGRAGKFATLFELAKGILGLGHVARENAEEIHPGGHFLRTLSGWFVTALHGPIAVLNAMLAVGALFLYLAALASAEAYATHLAVGALGVAAAIGGYFASRRDDSYLFSIFANWLLWSGVAFTLIVALTYGLGLNGHMPVRDWYGGLLIAPLNIIWLLCLAGVLGLLIGQALLNARTDRHDPRSIFPVVCAVMAVLWLVATSSFWASLFKTMEVLPGGGSIKPEELQSAGGLMFTTWLSMLIVIAVAVVAWLRRMLWAGRHSPKDYFDAPAPRLILDRNVGRAFSLAILLLAITSVGLAIINAAILDDVPKWLPEALDHGFSISVWLAVAAGSLYLIVWSQIAVGLGIAKDVITYFKGEPGRRNSTRQEFPLRARMHHRFVTVMETMIASEEPDEVIVVAHSQGTVIAIEAIRGNNTSLLFDTEHIKKRVLVTLGSPYSHIYEHYFASKFPLPRDFDTRLDRWINIYRIDDFVGTVVGDREGEWPENFAVPAGGHTGYWTDDEVRSILVGNVLPELA